MAEGGETINTGVDGFINLVRSSGKMEINDAATKLGLSRQVLEEWTAVLEEQGLIKVEYQLTKVYLVWIAKTKEEVEEKTSRFADVKATEVRRVESRVEELLELGRSLDLTVGQFKQISDIFEFKMGGVTDRLEKLRELEKARNELNYRSSDTEEQFKSRISGLKVAVDKSANKVDESKDAAAQLRKSVTDFQPTLMKMRVLAADADIQLNKVQDTAKGVKSQLADLEKRYAELGTRLEVIGMLLKEGESQVASVRQSLGKDTGGLVAQDAKVLQLEKAYNAEISEQLASLDALVKDFGSRVSRKAVIVGDLRMLKQERNALFAEMTALRKDLMALDFLKGGSESILRQIEEKKRLFAVKEKEIDEYQKKQAALSSEIVTLFAMKMPPQAGGGRGN